MPTVPGCSQRVHLLVRAQERPEWPVPSSSGPIPPERRKD
ncbi:conserved domain protein [Actinomyces sp. oral taxon 175 str. F0384]|nr:conserved domain protein [Actinomyces sp. oral taxon 175 str. F0384]